MGTEVTTRRNHALNVPTDLAGALAHASRPWWRRSSTPTGRSPPAAGADPPLLRGALAVVTVVLNRRMTLVAGRHVSDNPGGRRLAGGPTIRSTSASSRLGTRTGRGERRVPSSPPTATHRTPSCSCVRAREHQVPRVRQPPLARSMVPVGPADSADRVTKLNSRSSVGSDYRYAPRIATGVTAVVAQIPARTTLTLRSFLPCSISTLVPCSARCSGRFLVCGARRRAYATAVRGSERCRWHGRYPEDRRT